MNSLSPSTLSLMQNFHAEVRRLRDAAAYRHLHRSGSSDLYSSKLAAKNIRATLKHTFPAETFSVRMNGFIAITIRWESELSSNEVEACIAPFQMRAEQGNKSTPWQSVFGWVKTIALHREGCE
ncbi:LPD29 domain-containing protein [Pokkaliibacter plantistimulans]|uniref:LPD29 domain-containing protein n=1 Tax=Pokkaliibacter plantistimulans TaxID=1635171 RepID=UPI003990315F